MKKAVTKFRLFVLFLLHGKKKREKKKEIRMRWRSVTDQEMLNRVIRYKIMIENPDGSPHQPAPIASIVELEVLIDEFNNAKFEYENGKTGVSLYQLQMEREKMRNLLQMVRYYMREMNLTK